MNYEKINLENGKWVIFESGKDYLRPLKAITGAFDTETQVYFDGKILPPNQLFKKVKKLSNNEKRKRLSNITWAWQFYDEINGFFMTNDFEEWLSYQCRIGIKFAWCYNSTFDFSQIDYEILAKGKEKWKTHEHGTGKGYNKAQPFTFESIHNDTGARYCYKLWFPYKHYDRHTYVHAIEYRDFMKFLAGGLGPLLKGLDVRDNEGNEVRKLSMEYQEVNTDDLSQEEIDYCRNDVKGLYFAIKKFNETIEGQSNGECHIFGNGTNLMTAGSFAKHELLRSIYPYLKSKRDRIVKFQRDHPLSSVQDEYIRANHLYRGGISYVNPVYRGKMLKASEMGQTMKRFDVNSEYPYSMANIHDLVGRPKAVPFETYLAMKNKDDYEAIYILNSVSGVMKKDHLGLWYDPFKRNFVEVIDEEGTHLMFERELEEMSNWYDDLTFSCDKVILVKRGEKIFAPFVNENYEKKASAKKEGNKTLEKATKLLLNSSYGKLAERITRVIGHYELNEETGAIHFVKDREEIETNSSMNVIIGALVTSFARCYILSKIREVCKPNIRKSFVYIDTDSIHAFASYDKADAFALGGLKLEAECEAVKYIAPKTYIDIERINKNGTIDYDAFEVHSKGINLKAIQQDLRKKQKGKKNGKPTLELIDRKIDYGAKYICLVAMNVTGGKVLIPTEKYLARLELAPNEDDKVSLTNMEGAIFTER